MTIEQAQQIIQLLQSVRTMLIFTLIMLGGLLGGSLVPRR